MKRMLVVMLTYMMVFASAAWAHDAMYFYQRGVETNLANRKISYFTKAIELNSNLVEAYEKRSLLYYFQERYDKAIYDYSKVIELKPNDAVSYRMRGAAYLKKEELKPAIEDLTRAIELDPKMAQAYGDRAEAYRRAGMAADAVGDATKAIELRGDDRTTARAYATRAKAHKALGHEEQSDADLDMSFQLDPRYVLIRYLAGSTNLEGVRRMGLMGIIAICFVGIFQLSLRAPRKGKQR